MFGEVFSFDVPFLSRFSTDLPLDAVLDFGFQGTARNFAGQDGATDNVAGFYAADDYYTDADSNAYSLPLFLGNHDIGRIGLFLQPGQPGSIRRRTAGPQRVGPCADVLRARHAGRLLRRRAGLHRRRR